jgi:hypothetical protein
LAFLLVHRQYERSSTSPQVVSIFGTAYVLLRPFRAWALGSGMSACLQPTERQNTSRVADRPPAEAVDPRFAKYTERGSRLRALTQYVVRTYRHNALMGNLVAGVELAGLMVDLSVASRRSSTGEPDWGKLSADQERVLREWSGLAERAPDEWSPDDGR